ncbi:MULTISPECIES: hypothetical protein [unclassified Phenylobacterium]|uniref:hypothetical protein n=1 Tax=unclassified Phenylobacterium TaxID=2640670 RepID=UPI00083B8C5D|nr:MULTISPECIES: hypothetical protein [unclassified Phenylobacterium]
MGEQNRRAVEVEPPAAGAAPQRPPHTTSPARQDGPPPGALGPEADERQTLRQAPPTASPGESAEGDSIG